MDLIPSNNNEESLPQIKRDIMKVIAVSNQLKQKLKHGKLHFLELDSVIERSINIFLHVPVRSILK